MPSQRKRTASLLVLTLFSLIILPGCWSAHELNDEFILLGESVDKVGDHFLITFQVITPEQGSNGKSPSDKSSSNSNAPFFLVTGEGKTIAEAIKDYHAKLPRLIYGGHLEVVFISEDAAKDGIMPYLDYYARHFWSIDSSWLIITQGSARDMLAVQNPMIKYPTIGLEEMVKKHALQITNLNDFLVKYHSDSGMQVLTSAKIESPPKLPKDYEMEGWKVSNTALFNQDRLVGYLSPQDGECYSCFTQGYPRTDFPLKTSPFCPEGKLTVTLMGNPPKIEAIPSDKGLMLSVKVNLEFELAEDTCSVKLAGEQDIKALEESVNENYSKHLREMIEYTQQEKLDVFNVADRLHASHLELWREVKSNWPEVYSDLPLQIEVDAR
ncbi:MAG: Ger(x)C family spore germination protein, partial [Bacillota bacterium]|nr:Ger(x)C family spore germination protein [Bacillota bacterium]